MRRATEPAPPGEDAQDDDDELAGDIAALGIPEQAFARAPAADDAEPGSYAVWAENWDVLGLFLDCQTQWRTHAVSGLWSGRMIWQGLDYAGVAVAARARGLRLRGRLFDDVLVLERAALTELNRG